VFTVRAARVVMFSVMSVCVSVCFDVCMDVCVNTITPEPLEISSRKFRHSMVEMADRFENGYVGVRGW